MAIKYREDPDLSFLSSCDNDDLAILAQYLTTDKDGKTRFSEELLNDPLFKECNGRNKNICHRWNRRSASRSRNNNGHFC